MKSNNGEESVSPETKPQETYPSWRGPWPWPMTAASLVLYFRNLILMTWSRLRLHCNFHRSTSFCSLISAGESNSLLT